jgi:cytochrome c
MKYAPASLLSRSLFPVVLFVVQLMTAPPAAAQTGKKPVATKPAAARPAPKVAPKPPFATPQEIEEGKLLIPKSDCFACHKVSEKLIGPAYTAVAQKYPKTDTTVNSLVNKILHGGSGVWGQLAMAPHPNIKEEDAKKIVKYILSLSETNPVK